MGHRLNRIGSKLFSVHKSIALSSDSSKVGKLAVAFYVISFLVLGILGFSLLVAMFFSVGQVNSVANSFPGPRVNLKSTLVPSFHYLFYVFLILQCSAMMMICVLQVALHVQRVRLNVSHTQRAMLQGALFCVQFVFLSNTFLYFIAQITVLQSLSFWLNTPGVAALRGTHLAILAFQLVLLLAFCSHTIFSFLGATNNARLAYDELTQMNISVAQAPRAQYSGTSSRQLPTRKRVGSPAVADSSREENDDEYIEIPLGSRASPV